jgi:uncharacterized membrane protein YtjA (UPF0391 family)
LPVPRLPLVAAGQEADMLRWVLIFLVLALVSALLGFGGLAAGFAEIAKIIFVVFIVLFVIALIALMIGRRPPSVP